jgi:hypothetical protein
MHVRRGIIAGIGWGLVGLIAAAVGSAVLSFDHEYDLRSNLAWWQMHALPGIPIIPMLLFFAGVVTYMPARHVGFAKTLAILVVTTLPLAGILGALGMAHRRYKGIDHPPMYISEVFMFLVPIAAVSFLLIYTRSRPLPAGESSTVESLRSAETPTET